MQPVVTPKRSAPTNSIQKNMLIEYMEQNPRLKAGTFGPDFTFRQAQRLWEIISIKLNSVPGGAKKDGWRMWRKTWADMKKNAASKAIRNKKETEKTGGGTPPNIDLNNEDLMILDLINSKKIEGIPEIPESECQFNEEALFENRVPEVEINLENVQDEPQPTVIERAATPDDHRLYTVPGPGGKTKRQRLQTSLQISKQMVNQAEFQNNITNEYYKKKMAYLEHNINHKNKMLQLATENLEVAKENLEVAKENLKVFSSILNLLANKQIDI